MVKSGCIAALRAVMCTPAYLFGDKRREVALEKILDCLVGRVVANATAACRTRGLGFDARIGLSITGIFSVFRKFLIGSTESGIVPSIWQ
ncbi:hypothetical protein SFRURICE_005807 [Spodoptera frugiperda]|nr:hypothetical protein SFRURICE_005807 [Spodoptera frugiperda]